MAIYQDLMRGAAAGSIGAGAQIVTSRLIDQGGPGAPMLPTATLGVTVGVVTGQIHESLQRRGRSTAAPLAILMISLASTTATGLHRLLTGHRLMNDRSWPADLVGQLTYGVATYVTLRLAARPTSAEAAGPSH
jgi:hypothetical protein